MRRILIAAAAAASLAAAFAALAETSPKPAAARTAVSDLIDQSNTALNAQDTATARRLAEQAAASGDAEAINNLAGLVALGVGAPPDEAKARALFEQAIAAGSVMAKANLARHLMDDADSTSQRRAFELADQARRDEKVFPFTLYPLGRMILLGQGAAQDLKLGGDLLERSLEVEPNNADALYLVARVYQNGWGGRPRNLAKSTDLFRRAAEAGDPRAQRLYGLALLEGTGIAVDPLKAYGWFRKAAEAGRVDAMIDVAVMLALGEGGVPADPPQAREWYRKAAEAGSAHALRGLGFMLVRGEGGPVDRVTGRAYLELAAEAGDENAPGILKERLGAPTQEERAEADRIKADWAASHPPLKPD